jgi:predicted peptidase
VIRAIVAILGIYPSTLLAQAQTGFLDRRVTIAGRSYPYQVFVPANFSPVRRWPIILFLHGAGERGQDGLLQTQVGLGPAIRRATARFPAIVVFPQAPPESSWVGLPGQIAMAALDQTAQEFRADPDRVYLTGISLGGNGVWYLGYRYPTRFAALMPVCGFVTASWTTEHQLPSFLPADSGPPFEALARQLRHIPIWIVHGEIDDVVPVQQSREAAAALKAAGAPVRYLELPGTDHNSWDAAYRSPLILEWLFAQSRSGRRERRPESAN